MVAKITLSSNSPAEKKKSLFCHASPVVLWGQRKHKDPLGSALMKELRKQARSQVLTNPDSELKSHLAHTQYNQSTPTAAGRRGCGMYGRSIFRQHAPGQVSDSASCL